ncbi:M23 family metallopeptidase [Pseudactinotalea sp. Z1748]|uniref:M23 family metallopeptidase n=1 Tax=Pseudactinotalea sp. Z1748 TaxID=3413027 RepID=UPI003C7AB129
MAAPLAGALASAAARAARRRLGRRGGRGWFAVGALFVVLLVVMSPLLLVVGLVVMVGGLGDDEEGSPCVGPPGGQPVLPGQVPGDLTVGPWGPGEQLENAATIMAAAAAMGVSAHGQQIAVMTAIGESSLINLDHGDQAGPDSRGLFQQRDSWGPEADRMNPWRAAEMFYERLLEVEGWADLAPTEAAHRVQRNQDPLQYQPHWPDAVDIVAALSDGAEPGPGGGEDWRTFDVGPVRPQTQALADEIGNMWDLAPGDVHGWRASARDAAGHPAGLAIDFMVDVGPQNTPQGQQLGQDIVDHMITHADRLAVDYIIWRQAIWFAHSPQDGWQDMADRGDGLDPADDRRVNHFDHPHVNLDPIGAHGCWGDHGPGGLVGEGEWTQPAIGAVTSSYGLRWGAHHNGTDISGGSCDEPLYAASDGVVTYVGLDHPTFGLSGHVIVIEHEPGLQTSYNHMHPHGVLAQVGQEVEGGELIGLSGQEGNATGCHLHFSVWVAGSDVDPEPFMSERGATLG